MAMGFSLEEKEQWIAAFLQGKPLQKTLDLTRFTPFQRAILQAMEKIPFGETMTYAALAEKAGFPGAARAAGTVCRLNPYPIVYPCHRVVCASGAIGNYAYGAKKKQELLATEKKIAKSLNLP